MVHERMVGQSSVAQEVELLVRSLPADVCTRVGGKKYEWAVRFGNVKDIHEKGAKVLEEKDKRNRLNYS